MKKLVIKNISKEISDALIWEMAYSGCTPAFYEYAYRAKTKVEPSSKLSALHKKLKSLSIELPALALIRTMPKSQLLKLARELTLISPKLYDSPVRSLVSPLNSEKNNKFLVEERLGLKIGHIMDDFNKKRFRFTKNEEKLKNRDYYQLKASLLYLNWFLIKPTYLRPNATNVSYLFSSSEVKDSEKLSRTVFFDKLGILGKLKSYEVSYLKDKLQKNDTSKYFIRLSSNELDTYLKNISTEKINTISRLYSAIYEMDLIENDILDKLPIFILLNKRNFQTYPQVLKLYRLGYKRMLHLRFLKNECLDLMFDGKTNSLVKRLISH